LAAGTRDPSRISAALRICAISAVICAMVSEDILYDASYTNFNSQLIIQIFLLALV
jgi:hypothetical protein